MTTTESQPSVSQAVEAAEPAPRRVRSRRRTFWVLAGLFLLQLKQELGEKQPGLTIPQVSRILRHLLPHRTWSPDDLLDWLVLTQARNAAASRSHALRRQRNLLALTQNSP